MADKQHEDTPEFVPRRNQQLVSFFRKNGFGIQDIRIIGNENSPAVLYKDEYVLNCHVHNFDLKFTDTPFDGKTVKSYKLTPDEFIPDVRDQIIQLIQDYPARRILKISLEQNSQNTIYLCGWNHLNPEEKLGRYPVFGMYKPKVFFHTEKAQEIADELNKEGYLIKIV